MAEQYTVIAAIPTYSFPGGADVADVMEVSALTKPHEVSISVTVPKQPGWVDAAGRLLAVEAAEVEAAYDL